MPRYGRRPDPEFAYEWLTPELNTIVEFAYNCDMSWAQIRKMLIRKIEEMDVYIDDR